MWDHRIMYRVSIFGDIEIFLDNTPRVGEEWPVGANSTAILIRLSNTVGADCDQAAIANFELTRKLNLAFRIALFDGVEERLHIARAGVPNLVEVNCWSTCNMLVKETLFISRLNLRKKNIIC